MKKSLKSTPLIERIASRSYVMDSGCWEWSGFRLRGQHGVMTFKRRHTYVHRLAWEFFNGAIPDGLFVCHRCDNPPCWNPDHLFLGTYNDNNQDCISKKRHSYGTRNGHAKLTEDEVRRIATTYVPGTTTMQQVADQFGVSISRVYNIVRGRAWKQLDRITSPDKIRQNLMIKYQGRTQTVAQWSRETGIHKSTLRARFMKGLTTDRMFEPTSAVSLSTPM